MAYQSHIRQGGFYLDDWANGAGTLYPPGGATLGHALTYFSDLTLYRPVLVLYVPLTYFALGVHMHLQLAWVSALAVLIGVALYEILRKLRVPAMHALLIAALTLVYPWFDSTRFWMSASQASVSICFALGGLWLALVGLERQSMRIHLAATLLYLCSILTYEVTLPLIAVAGALYAALASWRAARTRWLLDLTAVVGGGLWVGLQTTREARGLSADLQHLGQIVEGGGTILGRTVIAFGQPHTLVALLVFGLVLGIGLAGYLFDRRRHTATGRWGPGSWLVLSVIGLVIAALGWMMFIPADPYYTPSVYGFTNRVNSLAGFGLVIALYGALGIVGATVGRVWRQSGAVALLVTLCLGVAVGATYMHVLSRHAKIWNTAFRAELTGIDQMRKQIPHPRSGTTVFTSGYPVYQTLGVPIFSTDWDVNGMIKLTYKNGTLSAYPVLPGLSLVCDDAGVKLRGPGAPPATAAYGSAVLLDVASGRHTQPSDRKSCAASAGSYVSGPLYLSLEY